MKPPTIARTFGVPLSVVNRMDGIVKREPLTMMDAGSNRVERPSRRKKDDDWSIEGGYQRLH
jgi:hypothetical protein